VGVAHDYARGVKRLRAGGMATEGEEVQASLYEHEVKSAFNGTKHLFYSTICGFV
jgi:hypothetical protein